MLGSTPGAVNRVAPKKKIPLSRALPFTHNNDRTPRTLCRRVAAWSRLAGRTFSPEILSRITETVKAEPGISRRQLSLRVCEWMDWRNASGRPQEMSCRKSLLELHRRGVVELPALTRRYAFQEARQALACPPIAEVHCTLAELGEVEIIRVTSNALSALWRGMLDAHHYLKSGPLCGAQLRYLV